MSILLLLTNPVQVVQTKFLEPGGDADFAVATTNGFWGTLTNAPYIATDFVHGSHLRSIGYRPSFQDLVHTPTTALLSAGSRFSFYGYFDVLPATSTATFVSVANTGSGVVCNIRLTTAGALQLWSTGAQIGTNGPTLSVGVYYRISLAYTIVSTTINRFELFVDTVSAISVTNATISFADPSKIIIGNYSTNTGLNFRSSDHYVDNSVSLTDTGDIWVTAKRSNANGTTNGFTTQIGAGGSGYGTGHSPQVNERALSITNGWSMVGAGAAITEQYNIEGKATGDTNITTGTIIDYMGWVSAKALVAAGASISINGVSTAISLTTAEKIFTKMAGSTTYPAGTGSDIGIITDTTLTTVSLYEAGIIVAYIPGATGGNNNQRFMLMGVG